MDYLRFRDNLPRLLQRDGFRSGRATTKTVDVETHGQMELGFAANNESLAKRTMAEEPLARDQPFQSECTAFRVTMGCLGFDERATFKWRPEMSARWGSRAALPSPTWRWTRPAAPISPGAWAGTVECAASLEIEKGCWSKSRGVVRGWGFKWLVSFGSLTRSKHWRNPREKREFVPFWVGAAEKNKCSKRTIS